MPISNTIFNTIIIYIANLSRFYITVHLFLLMEQVNNWTAHLLKGFGLLHTFYTFFMCSVLSWWKYGQGSQSNFTPNESVNGSAVFKDGGDFKNVFLFEFIFAKHIFKMIFWIIIAGQFSVHIMLFTFMSLQLEN